MLKNALMVVSLASVALFSVGCGGSACEKRIDALKSLNEKACESAQEDVDDEEVDEAIKECEEEFEKADDDLKKEFEESVDKQAECIDNLDSCEEGKEAEFQTAALKCLT